MTEKPYFDFIGNNGGKEFLGHRVKVYRNLTKKCYSVMDPKTGRVVAHSFAVCLKDVTFQVQQAGRERVLREKKKFVHAFVIGTVCIEQPVWEEGFTTFAMKYNPYKSEHFLGQRVEWGESPEEARVPITEATYVYLSGSSFYARLTPDQVQTNTHL